MTQTFRARIKNTKITNQILLSLKTIWYCHLAKRNSDDWKVPNDLFSRNYISKNSACIFEDLVEKLPGSEISEQIKLLWDEISKEFELLIDPWAARPSNYRSHEYWHGIPQEILDPNSWIAWATKWKPKGLNRKPNSCTKEYIWAEFERFLEKAGSSYLALIERETLLKKWGWSIIRGSLYREISVLPKRNQADTSSLSRLPKGL